MRKREEICYKTIFSGMLLPNVIRICAEWKKPSGIKKLQV